MRGHREASPGGPSYPHPPLSLPSRFPFTPIPLFPVPVFLAPSISHFLLLSPRFCLQHDELHFDTLQLHRTIVLRDCLVIRRIIARVKLPPSLLARLSRSNNADGRYILPSPFLPFPSRRRGLRSTLGVINAFFFSFLEDRETRVHHTAYT